MWHLQTTLHIKWMKKKSRIQETKNLLIDMDSSNDKKKSCSVRQNFPREAGREAKWAQGGKAGRKAKFAQKKLFLEKENFSNLRPLLFIPFLNGSWTVKTVKNSYKQSKMVKNGQKKSQQRSKTVKRSKTTNKEEQSLGFQ